LNGIFLFGVKWCLKEYVGII